MKAEFKGKNILLRQLSKVKIIYKQEYSFISIKFNVEGKSELYPYQVRVSVEMRAFQEKALPIVFLLHVVNGIVDELEIITADSTQIDADNLDLENVEYEINQEVIIKR